jgi:hypothetical protein
VVVGASAAAGIGRTGPAAHVAPSPELDLTYAYADGVLERDHVRWSVGMAGDVVTIGDWDCDGEPTPALLRPATGSVYEFGEWATTDTDVDGRLVGTAADAAALDRADVDGDGCDDLVLTDDNGDPAPLDAL